MGDLNVSDCSWKKMVIAKANDEWISTMKREQKQELSANNTSNFSMDYKVEVKHDIKKEETPSQSNEVEEEMLLQEIDPLSLYDEYTRKRRPKGSGPKCETPEERAVRLSKMSAYAAQRLANETPEQRSLRLKRMSEYAAKRLSRETTEQRALRLKRMSAYAAKRLSKESPEQRQARLSRMSAYAAKRHAMKKAIRSSSSESSITRSSNTPSTSYSTRDSFMPNQS